MKRFWESVIFKLLPKKSLITLIIGSIFSIVLEVSTILVVYPLFTIATSNLDFESLRITQILQKILSQEYTFKEVFVISSVFSLLLVIFSGIVKISMEFYQNRFLEKFRFKLSLSLLERYLSKEYSFFLKNNTSELSKNILLETDYVITYVLKSLITLLVYSFYLTFLFIALVFIDYKVALTILIFFGLVSLFSILYQRQKSREFGESLVANNKERFQIISETFGGIKILKFLDAESFFKELYSFSLKKLTRIQYLQSSFSKLPSLILDVVVFSSMITGIFSVFYFNDNGGDIFAKNLPLLSVYLVAVLRIKPVVQKLMSSMHDLEFGFKSLHNISGQFDFAYDSKLCSHSSFKSFEIHFSKEVILESIYFKYDKHSSFVLRDFNLVIKKGEVIGLSGKSGSGKTTLIDILMGLLIPDSGRIWVDGLEISKNEMHQWKRNIGYVPQHTFLLDSSVAQNIAFGIPNDEINYNRVKISAAQAQINSFIENELEDGYNTLVGERGNRFSGGQLQRIGIARALYNDPEIIILDEATSNLDERTESLILDSIYALKGRKTLLIISHNPKVLDRCDRIVDFNTDN